MSSQFEKKKLNATSFPAYSSSFSFVIEKFINLFAWSVFRCFPFWCCRTVNGFGILTVISNHLRDFQQNYGDYNRCEDGKIQFDLSMIMLKKIWILIEFVSCRDAIAHWHCLNHSILLCSTVSQYFELVIEMFQAIFHSSTGKVNPPFYILSNAQCYYRLFFFSRPKEGLQIEIDSINWINEKKDE